MTKIIETRGLKLEVPHNVYTPREDSFMVIDTLVGEELDLDFFCEIGPGTGIISLSIASPSSTILVTDINYQAANQTHKNARHNRFDNMLAVCGDLTRAFRQGALPEILIFNPPYLPEDPDVDPYSPTWENQQLVGGEQGDETINELIKNIEPGSHIVYTIISSLATNPVEFDTKHPSWKVRVLKAENMGFETIWLLKMEVKV